MCTCILHPRPAHRSARARPRPQPRLRPHHPLPSSPSTGCDARPDRSPAAPDGRLAPAPRPAAAAPRARAWRAPRGGAPDSSHPPLRRGEGSGGQRAGGRGVANCRGPAAPRDVPCSPRPGPHLPSRQSIPSHPFPPGPPLIPPRLGAVGRRLDARGAGDVRRPAGALCCRRRGRVGCPRGWGLHVERKGMARAGVAGGGGTARNGEAGAQAAPTVTSPPPLGPPSLPQQWRHRQGRAAGPAGVARGGAGVHARGEALQGGRVGGIGWAHLGRTAAAPASGPPLGRTVAGRRPHPLLGWFRGSGRAGGWRFHAFRPASSPGGVSRRPR